MRFEVRTVGNDGWESLPSPWGWSVPLPPAEEPASNLSADAAPWQPGASLGGLQSKENMMSRHQEHGTSSLEAIVIWLEAIASSLEAIAIRLEVFLSQSLMCTIYQAFRSSSRVFVSLLSFLLQPFYLTLVFPCFASGLKEFVGEILQDEKWWPPPLLSTSQNNDQEVDFGATQPLYRRIYQNLASRLRLMC